MKRRLRHSIYLLLITVFLLSSAVILQLVYDNRAAEQTYTAVQRTVLQMTTEPVAVSTIESNAVPEEQEELLPEETELRQEPVPLIPEPVIEEPVIEETAAFLLELDLEILRQTNEDVLGWIYIPDTPIDYPLMRARDNQEYLNRAWDGTDNRFGSIFMECRNSHDFSDFNTLIYGHNMRTEHMFGSLREYESQEYSDAHPLIYIVTDEQVARYEVFAAYEAPVVSDTYRLIFEDDARKQSALDFYLESSVIESDLIPTVDDRILTLSTCMGIGTYETRWVVQAILTGEFSR